MGKYTEEGIPVIEKEVISVLVRDIMIRGPSYVLELFEVIKKENPVLASHLENLDKIENFKAHYSGSLEGKIRIPNTPSFYEKKDMPGSTVQACISVYHFLKRQAETNKLEP